jgi:hypothetical protein
MRCLTLGWEALAIAFALGLMAASPGLAQVKPPVDMSFGSWSTSTPSAPSRPLPCAPLPSHHSPSPACRIPAGAAGTDGEPIDAIRPRAFGMSR